MLTTRSLWQTASQATATAPGAIASSVHGANLVVNILAHHVARLESVIGMFGPFNIPRYVRHSATKTKSQCSYNSGRNPDHQLIHQHYGRRQVDDIGSTAPQAGGAKSLLCVETTTPASCTNDTTATHHCNSDSNRSPNNWNSLSFRQTTRWTRYEDNGTNRSIDCCI